MANDHQSRSDNSRVFLFIKVGKSKVSPANVIYGCRDESRALELCNLFHRAFGKLSKGKFAFQTASTLTAAEVLLLQEALNGLELYDDPDPGIYEYRPSQFDIDRAAYMFRADRWNVMLDERIDRDAKSEDDFLGNGSTAPDPSINDDLKQLEARIDSCEIPKMKPEDARLSSLILLWLLTQAYYKLLESATSTAEWFCAADLQLNQAYLWTTKNIRSLLSNSAELKDFPGTFDPPFDDLYPSTIADCNWDEMVRPQTEQFLSNVQRYVMEKGIYTPLPGSDAATFVELCRPGIDNAVKIATQYSHRMQGHLKNFLENTKHKVDSRDRSNTEDSKVDKRSVFVVHGRNDRARQAIFAFLRSLDLKPLEWGQMVQATGKTNPYIGDVLETGFTISQAIIILFTPDDEARLRSPFHRGKEELFETNLTGQPRQNVLLEAGMALGRDANRTIIVELGDLRPISDLSGRHVVRMDDSKERRWDLVQRLKTAQCQVNTDGSDWMTAGDFSAAINEQISPQTPSLTSELSGDAKSLLRFGADDKNGTIVISESMHVTTIGNSNARFCTYNNGREKARWESAKNELLRHSLIEDYGGKPGTHYRITQWGYVLADLEFGQSGN